MSVSAVISAATVLGLPCDLAREAAADRSGDNALSIPSFRAIVVATVAAEDVLIEAVMFLTIDAAAEMLELVALFASILLAMVLAVDSKGDNARFMPSCRVIAVAAVAAGEEALDVAILLAMVGVAVAPESTSLVNVASLSIVAPAVNA